MRNSKLNMKENFLLWKLKSIDWRENIFQIKKWNEGDNR